jgi:hypothetical protein
MSAGAKNSMNSIYEVWLCSHHVRRSNGVAANQVSYVAVPRGPLDPAVKPDGAAIRLGTFLAASKDEAVRQAKENRRARPRR